MTCQEFRDRVFDFLEGKPVPGFGGHRDACPACAELVRGIEHNERVLAAARAPVAAPDVWPEIARAIARARPVRFARLRLAGFAAAAAGLLLAAAVLFSGPPPRRGPEIVIRKAGPEAHRALGALVPRYEDVDAATAMVDTLLRGDY
jgi:hypothetical protein